MAAATSEESASDANLSTLRATSLVINEKFDLFLPSNQYT